jgi:hypothetical protein
MLKCSEKVHVLQNVRFSRKDSICFEKCSRVSKIYSQGFKTVHGFNEIQGLKNASQPKLFSRVGLGQDCMPDRAGLGPK